jgi:sec-independent protein translocase protein TatA
MKMGNFGFGELLIILFIIFLLFGGKKIPELAKGLGQGIKSFKKALSGEEPENQKKDK